jgi:hypothetical protein
MPIKCDLSGRNCLPKIAKPADMHPVVGGSISVFGPKLAQERACGEVFNLAYCAARDRIEACKLIEIEAAKKQGPDEVAEFRRTADALAANGLRDPDANTGAAAALRLAIAKEEEFRRRIALMRDSDDPLIIHNDRGDRVVRGVQTGITAGLLKIFGSPMYGTATRLTQIALNQKVTFSRFSGHRIKRLGVLPVRG